MTPPSPVLTFTIRTLVVAASLWVATVLVGGIRLDSAGTSTSILTLIGVALVFGLVNAVVKPIVATLGCPLYILTLGLVALVVNGLMLLLVAWISTLIGFGLTIENFWWGVLGALLLGVFSWLIGILLRPFTGKTR